MAIGLLLGATGCSAALPGSGRATATPPSGSSRPTTLREVAPPLAVQQLQAALAEHQPAVEILSPRAGSTLPEGPWTLQLAVRDWPLVDAGPLGLGPHLVLQIDDEAPRRLTDAEGLRLTLPPLNPGSHRITVYAARPWGEAVKSPGAQAQIVVHRVAANPLGVPAAGTPQLILTSPTGPGGGQPVLLDWLLLDAPLQHLRPNDEAWRLRVTVNGDSFLVDRQEPLWLQGWKRGSNALVLELVDGQGEPLNPPFNTLVQEVPLEPGGNPPAWLGGRLEPVVVEQLLGLAPPPAEPASEEPLPDVPAAAGEELPSAEDTPSAAAVSKLEYSPEEPAVMEPSEAEPVETESADSEPAETDTTQAEPAEAEPTATGPAVAELPEAASPAAPEPEPSLPASTPEEVAEVSPENVPASPTGQGEAAAAEGALPDPTPAGSPEPTPGPEPVETESAEAPMEEAPVEQAMPADESLPPPPQENGALQRLGQLWRQRPGRAGSGEPV
ncbi:MAG: hypothetical protein VKJ66_08130 [Synechococcus sp.]|nr:hypothetical protein [Synechococcus sp.]